MQTKQWSKGKRCVALVVLFIVLLAVIVTGGLAWSGYLTNVFPFLERTSTPVVSQEGQVGELPADPVRPNQMRAFWLEAGRDFGQATAQQPVPDAALACTQVDEAIVNGKAMGFNAVIVSAVYDGRAVSYADAVRGISRDMLSYTVQKAQAAGLYVIGAVGAQDVISTENGTADVQRMASLCAAYGLDGMMLAGFDRLDWNASPLAGQERTDALTAAVGALSKAAQQANPKGYFGVGVPPVWANKSTNENGSDTQFAQQSLTDLFADTRAWAQAGTVQFIYVDARVSTVQQDAPYAAIMNWWAQAVQDTGVDLLAGHAADLVCTDKLSWAAPDELIKQMIALEGIPACIGNGFYSYTDLVRNPYNSTQVLRQYFEGTVQNDLILSELAVTAPSKTKFTTNESVVTFVGSSDPNFPVLLGGQELERTELGYFSVDIPLNLGENTITIEHKGKTVVYTITYRMEVLKSVSPTDNVNAPGGTQVTISAVALKGASVSATVNGTAVSMKVGSVDSGENKPSESSDFCSYVGTYTLPQSQEKEQNLGSITVRSNYKGQTDSMKGGSVTVSAKPKEWLPDPDRPVAPLPGFEENGPVPELLTPYSPQAGMSGQSQMCEVIASQAEGLDSAPLDERSTPLKTPLLAGTFDYITGSASYSGHKYYYLASGRRVYQSDVKAFTGYTMPNNAIRAYSASASGSTRVTVATAWKVPFNVTVGGQSYYAGYESRPYNIRSYTASYVDIVFYHTAQASGDFNLSSGGTVSKTEWIRDDKNNTMTLRLHLKKTGAFYGYQAYYNSNGTLSFTLKSGGLSSDNLSGYTIMLDAGHGSGKDAGGANTCLPGLNEGDVNMQLAKQIKAELESKGARVLMARPGDYDEYMDDRVALCQQQNPDMYISVHCDSADAKAQGTTSYYYTPWSFDLAEMIHQELYSTYVNQIYKHSVTNRETKFYPFQVTRVFECPAVLIEYGFVTNQEECNALVQPANQKKLAQATVQGIIRYLKNR